MTGADRPPRRRGLLRRAPTRWSSASTTPCGAGRTCSLGVLAILVAAVPAAPRQHRRARVLASAVADGERAVVNFVFLPAYPWWCLLTIAFDLTRHLRPSPTHGAEMKHAPLTGIRRGADVRRDVACRPGIAVPASAHDRVRRRTAWAPPARSAGCGTVLLHRPGPELRRLTPRNNDQLLFDGVPWVDRAQEEHDAFAAGAARPRRRGAAPGPAAGRGAVVPVRPRRADRRRGRRPPAGRDAAAGRHHAPGRARPRGPRRHADRRAGPRRAARRARAGLRGDGPRRTSSSRRCPTCCSPATPRSGWATRWP